MANKETYLDQVVNNLFDNVHHYYIWDNRECNGKIEKHPVATVVIGRHKKTNEFCRGISICSIGDNFDRVTGYNLALSRLVKSVFVGNGERIMPPADRRRRGTRVDKSSESVLRACQGFPGGFFYKHEFAVILTPKEKQILHEVTA